MATAWTLLHIGKSSIRGCRPNATSSEARTSDSSAPISFSPVPHVRQMIVVAATARLRKHQSGKLRRYRQGERPNESRHRNRKLLNNQSLRPRKPSRTTTTFLMDSEKVSPTSIRLSQTPRQKERSGSSCPGLLISNNRWREPYRSSLHDTQVMSGCKARCRITLLQSSTRIQDIRPSHTCRGPQTRRAFSPKPIRHWSSIARPR
jgi:hypothetical protein